MDAASKSIRRASVLVAFGLAIEVVAFVHWAPMTFIVFAAVGLPFIVGGVGWYFIAVLAFLREKKAL
ncbi:MAG: hypothetical protein AAF658_00220 [Myxococcota bacterium]